MEGYGDVIITLTLLGDGYVLLDTRTNTAQPHALNSFVFHVPEGRAYAISREARSTWTHGVIVRQQTADMEAARVSITVRYCAFSKQLQLQGRTGPDKCVHDEVRGVVYISLLSVSPLTIDSRNVAPAGRTCSPQDSSCPRGRRGRRRC
jgi:hypothetical protein